MTNYNRQSLRFPPCRGRSIAANLDGGEISSDGGALLLRETDRRLNLRGAIARVLADPRRQASCEHGLLSLIRQRIYALALGYEDPGPKFSAFFHPLLQARQASETMGALAVHAEPGSRVPHRGHAVRNAYHLFAATSRIASSSRSRSARGFFKRAFSSCSLFSSPTWRGCMQRIDAATRTASAQRPGTFEPSPPPRGRMTLERH